MTGRKLIHGCTYQAGKVKFGQPLEAFLGYGDSHPFILYAPAIRLYGVGKSYNAAVNDLGASMIELYEIYKDTPERKLHESARDELARLAIYITDR